MGAPPPALTCTPLCALAHRCCCALAGIPAAAGLTIEEEKIGAFRKAINDWAAKEYLVPKPLPLKDWMPWPILRN